MGGSVSGFVLAPFIWRRDEGGIELVPAGMGKGPMATTATHRK